MRSDWREMYFVKRLFWDPEDVVGDAVSPCPERRCEHARLLPASVAACWTGDTDTAKGVGGIDGKETQ